MRIRRERGSVRTLFHGEKCKHRLSVLTASMSRCASGVAWGAITGGRGGGERKEAFVSTWRRQTVIRRSGRLYCRRIRAVRSALDQLWNTAHGDKIVIQRDQLTLTCPRSIRGQSSSAKKYKICHNSVVRKDPLRPLKHGLQQSPRPPAECRGIIACFSPHLHKAWERLHLLRARLQSLQTGRLG